MGKAKQKIKDIVRDLTSLEINTIRRVSITGERMSDPRHALHDIAASYNTELNGLLEGRSQILGECTCYFDQRDYRPEGHLTLTIKAPPGTVGEARMHLEPPSALDAMVLMRPLVEIFPAPKGHGKQEFVCDEDGKAELEFLLADDTVPCLQVQVRTETDPHWHGMEVPMHKVRGSLLGFHYLNRRANHAKADQRAWLLRRIELNSVRLAGMLETMPSPYKKSKALETNDYSRRCLNGAPEKHQINGKEVKHPKPPEMKLKASDLVSIRKIWELRCEEIVMQTVVQLDGDVVTRVSPSVAHEGEEVMHKLHAEGVRVATQSWQYLVESVTSFARSLLGFFH